MKIGLITVYYANYGSYFQTLALKKKIEDMGHECETINATIRGLRIYKYLLGICGKYILPERIQQALANKIPAFRIYMSLSNDFKKINISKVFQSRRSIYREYDCIIIGSDELWSSENPEMGYVPAYYGVNIDLPIFSYATSGISFGKPTGKRLEEISNGLEKFLCISVRDDITYQSITDIRGFNSKIPQCVKNIDPTLLNPCFIQKAHEIKDYILVYGEEFEEKQVEEIRQLSREMGLKIIGISWKHNFLDSFATITSAAEFQKYFAESRYCITSTFHGTVFSILNHKQFVAFPTNKRAAKIIDLLAMLHLSDRLYENGKILSKLPEINYSNVEKELSVLRRDGTAYLEAAFQSVGEMTQ